jgi:hypothetical protein
MNKLNIALALVLGVVVGGAVNMSLIVLGPAMIAPPPGADMTTAEGMASSMHLLQPRHFVVPFLAHALGTFAGALAGSLLAAQRRAIVAITIGVVFLFGGIAASLMIPAPAWFIALDLTAAYLPMAWLGLAVARRLRPVSPPPA